MGGGEEEYLTAIQGICTITQWIYWAVNLRNLYEFGLVRMYWTSFIFFLLLSLPPSFPSFSPLSLSLAPCFFFILESVHTPGTCYSLGLPRRCWSWPLLPRNKALTEQLPQIWSHCTALLMPKRDGSLLAGCLPSECSDTLLSALVRDSK